jgi:dTDP-4-dehydrorhamnose reductase
MKVLVLGASGMIGRTMFRVLSQESGWDVSGSIRSKGYEGAALGKVFADIDLINSDHLIKLFNKAKPDIVVNCAGLTKHVPEGNDPIPALNMNALLPHRLAAQCAIAGARLIHISTDCVFSGKSGNYQENDETDALDVYGKTKALGEVTSEKSITLRTSTIGHEYGTSWGLLEWFLAQKECKGFKHAIFSGLPTVELARVVRDIVIPNSSLTGLYNVGAKPIDKFSLLNLIAKVYQKNTKIEIEDKFRIDRSLDVEKFSNATGYQAAAWPELIESMYEDYLIGI